MGALHQDPQERTAMMAHSCPTPATPLLVLVAQAVAAAVVAVEAVVSVCLSAPCHSAPSH
jgi:hypothetical protein